MRPHWQSEVVQLCHMSTGFDELSRKSLLMIRRINWDRKLEVCLEILLTFLAGGLGWGGIEIRQKTRSLLMH